MSKHVNKRVSKISYDPETGIFARTNGTRKLGSLTSYGYIAIKYNGERWLAHRLAWTLMYGSIPAGLFIDHINLIKTDNRISNLRLATNAQNMQNRVTPLRTNQLKILGVSESQNHQGRKFYARIHNKGKIIRLGSFYTKEEAHEAYIKAKRELHEFNTM